MPLLVDLQPAGRFLMEDFHRAGGLLAVLREVADLLDPAALTVTGRPLVDYLDDAEIWDREVIRAATEPLQPRRRHRRAARQPRPGRRRHQAGRRVAAPAAAPRPGGGLRLASRTCTPASTTPTWTSTPTRCSCCAAAARRATRACRRSRTCRCRRSCCAQGVRDMVRICDGRMSGTAYGTVVLHVAPEAAAGGPLGLVRTGDSIVLDVPGRRLDVDVPGRRAGRPAARRRPPSAPSPRRPAAGSGSTSTTSRQADTGADLDFLRAGTAAPPMRAASRTSRRRRRCRSGPCPPPAGAPPGCPRTSAPSRGSPRAATASSPR